MSVMFPENRTGFPFINSFSVSFSSDDLNKCTIVSMLAKADTKSRPIVRFKTVDENGTDIYTSPDYSADFEDNAEKQWRLPPLLFASLHYVAEFEFTKTAEFEILKFETSVEEKKSESNTVLFDAHLGFFAAAPQNTIPAFKIAGICGFDGCITVPKITKDGVFVCIHDDTINNTARTYDGKKIKDPVYVKDVTYDELLNYDFGISKNPVFEGTKIPLLDDYFQVCKEYDMSPIFSVHPDFTDEQWYCVRKKLEKYGILSKFKIKSSSSDILAHTFKIFGNDIAGYILWNFTYEEKLIDKLKSVGFDTTKCNGIIEIEMKNNDEKITSEIIKKIEANDFYYSSLACWERKTGEYFKRLIKLGVKEVTEDYHCSFGLNW